MQNTNFYPGIRDDNPMSKTTNSLFDHIENHSPYNELEFRDEKSGVTRIRYNRHNQYSCAERIKRSTKKLKSLTTPPIKDYGFCNFDGERWDRENKED